MSRIELKNLREQFDNACNYPGRLDAPTVERHLADYLEALGVQRTIRRLNKHWTLENEPVLGKYVNAELDEFKKLAARDTRDAGTALNAQDARDARAVRAARDARDAQDALDARDARAVRAVRAARDALDNFMAWCIQANGWRYWRFDLSWVATTYFGANTKRVKAWSEPILRAFIAGAWMLHWTKDTLYWIAKPTVHVEKTPIGRRLHNEKGPALESDAEDLYFWHGVLVPKFVISDPESITIKHIFDEKNIEVRRVMIERYGEERYIVDSGMKPVAHDENFGTLYVENMEVGKPISRVKVINRSPEPDGSFKAYWIPVNPELYNGDAGKIPRAAVASTWRTTPGGKTLLFKDWRQYAPVIET